jgi:hypothetical protein
MGGTVRLPTFSAFMAWTGTALLLNNNDGGDGDDDDKYKTFLEGITLHVPHIVTTDELLHCVC